MRTIGVIVAVVVLGMLVYLAAERFVGETGPKGPATRVANRATTKPAGKPKPQTTVDMAMIVSPAELGISKDSTVNRLISKHNQWEDALKNVVMRGSCTWVVDGPGAVAPMVIGFDRQGQVADLVCGPRKCKVATGKVTMDFDSAMNIDSLYLLVFRKFDPAEFQISADVAEEGQILLESKMGKLIFDADSGRLVQADVTTEKGTISARFADFVPMSADGAIEMPTTIALTIPKKVYPFAVKDETGLATFTMDPSQSKVGE